VSGLTRIRAAKINFRSGDQLSIATRGFGSQEFDESHLSFINLVRTGVRGSLRVRYSYG
jgi:hypothetical protein